MPEPQQPRYVQMPDESYVEWPEGVSAEDFKAKVAGKYGNEAQGPGLTGIEHHQVPHSAAEAGKEVIKGVGNIGAGGLGTLATIGRLTPWGAAADKLMGGSTIYGEGYDALTHPKETAKSVGRGLLDMAKHPLETAETAIGAAGAGGLVPEGAGLVNKIPSRARAAGNFETVMKAAENEPVAMTRSMPHLVRTQELAERGANPVRAASQLFQRTQNVPGTEGSLVNPLTYKEARDFATNLSNRSWMEKMGTSKPMAGELRQLSHTFNQDVGDAAESAGVGPQYRDAMKEYAQNARLRNLVKGGLLIPAAGYAANKTGLLGKVVKGAAGGGQ